MTTQEWEAFLADHLKTMPTDSRFKFSIYEAPQHSPTKTDEFDIKDGDFAPLIELKSELQAEANSNKFLGIAIGIAAFCAFVVIYYFINFRFDPIEEARLYNLSMNKCETTGFVVFQLGVKLINGSLMTAVFYFIFKLCIGSFDQSERYNKRRHSLYGFKFLYTIDRKNRIPVDDKIKIIEILNKPIESAHTSSEKFDSRSLFQKLLDKLDSIRSVKKGDIEVNTSEPTNP